MSLDPAIRRRLYARRAALGLSQRALAKRMATTQSHISELENGIDEPSFGMLDRWAEALDLRVRILLDSPEPSKREDD